MRLALALHMTIGSMGYLRNMGKKQILFICTGNYYRSRFAEALFNYEVERRGLLGWQAFSRGLAIHLASGDLSFYTADALKERGIDLRYTAPTRVQLGEEDLHRATRVIALDKDEHERMIRRQFRGWESRVEFWSCPDMDYVDPALVLPMVEEQVLKLVESL